MAYQILKWVAIICLSALALIVVAAFVGNPFKRD